MAFKLGDRVVLKDGKSADLVGVVVRIEDQDTISVHWEGSDVASRSFRYASIPLELWEPEERASVPIDSPNA